MKLSLLPKKIIEDTSRRQFLRSAGAVMTSGNPLMAMFKSALGKKANIYGQAIAIFKQLSPKLQNLVQAFQFDLWNSLDPNDIEDIDNFKLGDYHVRDGTVHYKSMSFPIKAVLGKSLSDTDFNDPGNIANMWLSGESPDMINKFAPNAINDILQVATKRHGAKEFLQELRDLASDTESHKQIWTTALQHPLIRKITGMGPEEFSKAFDDPSQLHKLVKNGTLDIDSAKAKAEYLQGRKDKDTYKEYTPPDNIRIEPGPDDYIYGSPMHQPFESKLHSCLFARAST